MAAYDDDYDEEIDGEVDREMVIKGQAMGPGRKKRKFARRILLEDKRKIKLEDVFYPLRLLKRNLYYFSISALLSMIFMITLYSIECPVQQSTRLCRGSTKKLACEGSSKDFYRECWKPEISCWLDKDTRCAPTQCMVHSLACPDRRICISSEFKDVCADNVLNVFRALSAAWFSTSACGAIFYFFSVRSKRSEIAVDHIIEEDDDEEELEDGPMVVDDGGYAGANDDVYDPSKKEL